MSVFKPKNCKVWRYDFWLNGVRYYGTLPDCRTKSEARAAEDEARHRARQGEAAPQQKVLFTDFLKNEFIPWSAREHSPDWHQEVKYLIRHFQAFFANRTVDSISAFDIEKYKLQRKETPTRNRTPRSAASVNRELAVLSSVFTLALKDNLIERNPCAQVKTLVEDNERDRILEPDEEERLFRALRERHLVVRDSLLPLVTLAIHTGLRKSELLGLRKDEVDFVKGEIRKGTSKNKRRRRVRLNVIARETLAAAIPLNKTEWVFVNPETQKPYTDVKVAWRNVLKTAKIKGLRWHDLRHTFASQLVEAGAHQVEIRDLLGHTSTRTTDRYTKANDGRTLAVVESLAERRKAG